MKKMKKIVSLIAALVMVFAMTTTAFAADNGAITINQATAGQTYSAYRIFDLESYSGNAYSYTVNDAWKNFVNQATIKGVYVTINDEGYVSWVESADAATFAKTALAYAKANSIQAVKSAEATGTTVELTGLPLGYYLVDSTVGTLCSLSTTAPTMTVNDKNEKATVDKNVLEDSTTLYGKTNDADLTDTITYQATITAKKGAQNYVLHDTMSAGLDFVAVTGVTKNNNTVTQSGNYEVKTTGITAGETFNVVFSEAFCNALATGDSIVVTYTAKFNENAVIGGDGNTNNAVFTFGENNDITATPVSQTVTKVFDFKIFKYTETDTPLAGAKFVLSNANGKYATFDADNKLTGWVESEANATKLESGTDGYITVTGLDAETYTLKETDAPTGYNKISDTITVTIGSDGVVENTTENTVKVLNNAGSVLPTTGGIGTTLFYVIGAILVIGAAVLLITKKRMSAE